MNCPICLLQCRDTTHFLQQNARIPSHSFVEANIVWHSITPIQKRKCVFTSKSEQIKNMFFF